MHLKHKDFVGLRQSYSVKWFCRGKVSDVVLLSCFTLWDRLGLGLANKLPYLTLHATTTLGAMYN